SLESADAAMRIADRRVEQDVENACEHRIADIAVLPWHGAGFNVSLEPRSHAQVGAAGELGHHRDGVVEVIGAVGISHHDVTAGRSRHAPLQSRAVAAPCNWHAVRTEPLCNGLAAVSATVVSDDNLALEAERQSHLVERLVSVRNALRQAMRLIEARHD